MPDLVTSLWIVLQPLLASLLATPETLSAQQSLPPPVSAAQTSGNFGWLNVVNASISFDAAMTGLPIEAAGYANPDSGTAFEVTFNSGVVNGSALVNTGACGIMLVDLTPPIGVLPFLTADVNGNASISSTIPAAAFGMTLYFQALDFTSCTLSNAVTTVVL